MNNVDQVRSHLDNLDRAVEALGGILHDDAEWMTQEAYPLPDIPVHLKGKSAILAFYGEYAAMWTDWTADVEELVDAGDTVVVQVRERARGRTSGAAYDRSYALVYRFRNGLVAHLGVHPDLDSALAAESLTTEH